MIKTTNHTRARILAAVSASIRDTRPIVPRTHSLPASAAHSSCDQMAREFADRFEVNFGWPTWKPVAGLVTDRKAFLADCGVTS